MPAACGKDADFPCLGIGVDLGHRLVEPRTRIGISQECFECREVRRSTTSGCRGAGLALRCSRPVPACVLEIPLIELGERSLGGEGIGVDETAPPPTASTSSNSVRDSSGSPPSMSLTRTCAFPPRLTVVARDTRPVRSGVYSLASTATTADAAAAHSSSVGTRASLRKPSPPVPNARPGETTIPASRRVAAAARSSSTRSQM